MTTPYSIEIFVPDGDPDGLWVVNQRNWTGVSLVFPRQNWANTKKRSEFDQAGIYILTGYHEDNPDLPVLYIGQTDNLGKRIEQHARTKDFWDKAVIFVATNNFLNRAHVTWLEWYLYDRASQLGRCQLENSQTPQIPTMSEAESADMHVFSDQMQRKLNSKQWPNENACILKLWLLKLNRWSRILSYSKDLKTQLSLMTYRRLQRAWN